MADESIVLDSFSYSTWIDGPADGRPVLFLHGFPQTRHTWRDQVPAVAAAGHRGVAPDQRGYSPGARPGSVDQYTTDLLVGDVLRFAEWAGGQVDLVGHDWGGQLAWLTAAHHPEVVRSLTVLSRPHPAAFAAAFAADEGQAERSKHHKAFHNPQTVELLLADDARRLRRMLAGSAVPAADIDAYLSVLGDPDALEAAVNWYRATPPEGLRAADTPIVEVPTLYVWGTADHSVGRAAAELTEMFVAGAYHFVELEGGGHFLTDDGRSADVTDAL
ncbi:MAG: alpha/beta hydrolase, partial [Actinomycetota bacterium]|nr:alpha/beta hydrolase [Actinomycetota bacterium]